MPSPRRPLLVADRGARPRLGPALALVAAALVLAGGNLWVTLARSTIPLHIDGRVSDIELRFEKNPGVDDVYLVTVGDRTIHVDAAVGPRLGVGNRLRKDRWERHIHVDDRAIPLSPSRDFRRMLGAMPLVATAVGLLVMLPRSAGRRSGPRLVPERSRRAT